LHLLGLFVTRVHDDLAGLITEDFVSSLQKWIRV